jgi:hypothetical protein
VQLVDLGLGAVGHPRAAWLIANSGRIRVDLLVAPAQPRDVGPTYGVGYPPCIGAASDSDAEHAAESYGVGVPCRVVDIDIAQYVAYNFASPTVISAKVTLNSTKPV